MSAMDEFDKRILRAVQENGLLTAAELGERAGLTAMPAWRRLKRLRELGVVRETVALLDPRAVGLTLTAFVMLRTRQHDAAWFAKLERFAANEPSVVEFHRMSGEIDFMMKVVLRDMDDYRDIYRRLTAAVDLLDVATSFAFETLKDTARLPVA
jgi:Lrp/AsnC family transcriptional regulator